MNRANEGGEGYDTFPPLFFDIHDKGSGFKASVEQGGSFRSTRTTVFVVFVQKKKKKKKRRHIVSCSA